MVTTSVIDICIRPWACRYATAKGATHEPRGQYNADAVDTGAWVPATEAPADLASHGLPNVPNIVVPWPGAKRGGAFFTTFSPHYALSNIKLSISQAQAEFVAARVSSINECFY